MNRYQAMELAGWNLIVYLPPSYHESDVRFPVAYVQDGGEQFDHTINQIEMLFREGQLTELILVGIEPHNRNDEYTPWPAASLIAGNPSFGGRGRIYIDCVADVIKPHIDATYRTKAEREHTAILGGSFGGLVSMFASYWRPDIFGKIGMLSASFWYEGVMDFLRGQSAPSSEQWLYMSVGSCEGIYKRNVQKQMVRNTLEVRDLWLDKGYPAKQLCFELLDGGTHDAVFMAERFPNALKWLFEGKKLSAKDIEKPNQPSIPGTHYFDMTSSHSGRNYRLFVYVPSTPAPSAGYPIIYSLDGNASFHSLVEAMRLQSRHPLGIEPAVIVGIGYESDEPIVSEQRFYDYTELADPSVMRHRPDGSPWPATGGAEEFLTFIEDELKSEIGRKYAIDRNRQALFGHSLGGWFALYVLFTRPEAFRSYIAGSPSVWWNDKSLLARLPELKDRLQQGQIDAELMIAVGSEEKQMMVENAQQLYTLLQSYDGHGLRLAFELFEGEGHVSVVHPLISRLFRFILQRKQP
ncbi:alpha/beta hydrolase [uncultured Brevibacillus sp.]|uniref:alpha/beta hydrolase n=1 Tax=uncultured Brevibacillus sp. TaxID=169970 RepID=UPI00259A1969|nr:alpha/beta hydrolase-fold protein [uncultured Brevibacillus sp.]